jgi:hypothetical protein
VRVVAAALPLAARAVTALGRRVLRAPGVLLAAARRGRKLSLRSAHASAQGASERDVSAAAATRLCGRVLREHAAQRSARGGAQRQVEGCGAGGGPERLGLQAERH